VLAWTDDDTQPADRWLASLCKPLLTDSASDAASDVTSGCVNIPANLSRDWLTPTHRERLASSKPAGCHQIVGANMAFRRDVLKKVPRFDVRLGPGALGFGDDTLFGMQLEKAGFRHKYIPDACLAHDFFADRLLHGAWHDSAVRMAASFAYIAHHWEHEEISYLSLRSINIRLKLSLHQLFAKPFTLDTDEGISLTELKLVDLTYFYRFLALERQTSRRYKKHGLSLRS